MTRSKTVILAVLSVFVSIIVYGSIYAAEKAPVQEVKLIKKTDRTEVQLSQQAERMEARNRILVKLTIEVRGNNTRQIQLDINKRMSAAITKARSNPAITVETGSYSVSRPYDARNEKEAARWRGSQTLSLTSDNFEAALNIAGELQNDGLVLSDMRFFVAPETLKAVQDELTTAALRTLREHMGSILSNRQIFLLTELRVETN